MQGQCQSTQPYHRFCYKHSDTLLSSDRNIEHLVTKINIYILNVAALDETIIPSRLHFSMQNIEQSRGLGRASRWSNVNVNE